MIRVFEPTLGAEELAAIAETFADRWPGAGPKVKAFESAFADYTGAERNQMISVTSCTEGLFQSVGALGLTDSEEVILPSISFIGAAHAVRASGGRVRLTDVDTATLNPRPEHVEATLSSRTRAIILLHFGGQLTWIREIAELAAAKKVLLIEDSACALGGKQEGISYGMFGDIGVWSFDAMKLLVTGDGGMIRVADETLRQKIFDGVHLGGARPGLESQTGTGTSWWEINPRSYGRRTYMNDIAASIGLIQLRRIESFVTRRRSIAQMYDHAFRDIPWIQLPPDLPTGHVPFFYWIQTSPNVRDKLAKYLRERDIYTTFKYWPLHRTKLYADEGLYPGAEAASDSTLLLPVHQNLSDSEVAYVIESVTSFKANR
jgi:dTDP-4-amino-4,6-dideoxygalactose transaminase